jgi:hypothetical protein
LALASFRPLATGSEGSIAARYDKTHSWNSICVAAFINFLFRLGEFFGRLEEAPEKSLEFT